MPARRLDLVVRHYVVALVQVFAHRRLEINEGGDLPRDPLAELQLAEIGLRQAYIIGLPLHLTVIVDRM